MGKKAKSAVAAAENIRVAIRLRDLLPDELKEGAKSAVRVDAATNQLVIQDEFNASKTFAFDALFDNRFTQRDLFVQEVQPLIDAVFNGYNATLFAYGQSGTGKTYTMTGKFSDKKHWGMLPQVLEQLLEDSQKMSTNTKKIKLSISYLEIYLGSIYDLMVGDGKGNAARLPDPVPTKNGSSFTVPNLSTHDVENIEECIALFEKGTCNRTVEATNMNGESSRSHALFTFNVEQWDYEQDPKNPIVCTSKVTVVDLAGSERLDRTGAEGVVMKQGIAINSELQKLALVIDRLVKGEKPTFRESSLNKLLKDSIGGNSKTILFATVGPAAIDVKETISTLRFAQNAKRIKNEPTKNIDPKDAKILELSQQVEALLKKLGMTADDIDAENAERSADVEAVRNELAEAQATIATLEADVESEKAKVAALQQEAQTAGNPAELLEAQEKVLSLETDLFSTKDKLSKLMIDTTSCIRRCLHSEALEYVLSHYQQPQPTPQADDFGENTPLVDPRVAEVWSTEQLSAYLPAFSTLQETWRATSKTQEDVDAAKNEATAIAATQIAEQHAELEALRAKLMEVHANGGDHEKARKLLEVEVDSLRQERDKLAAKISKDQARFKEKLQKAQEEAAKQTMEALAAIGYSTDGSRPVSKTPSDTPATPLADNALNTAHISDIQPISTDAVDGDLLVELQAQIRLQHQLNKIEQLRHLKLEQLMSQYKALRAGECVTDPNTQQSSHRRNAVNEEQLAALVGQLNSVSAERAASNSQLSILQEDNSELKRENATLNEYNHQLATRCEELNLSVTRAAEEKQNVSNKLERRTKKMEEMAAQLNKLYEDMATKENQISTLSNDVLHAEAVAASSTKNLAAQRELAERAHSLLEAERCTVKLRNSAIARLKEDLANSDDMWKDRLEDCAEKLIKANNDKIEHLAALHKEALDAQKQKTSSVKKKLVNANEKVLAAVSRFEELVYENELLQTQFEEEKVRHLRSAMSDEQQLMQQQRDHYKGLVQRPSNAW